MMNVLLIKGWVNKHIHLLLPWTMEKLWDLQHFLALSFIFCSFFTLNGSPEPSSSVKTCPASHKGARRCNIGADTL